MVLLYKHPICAYDWDMDGSQFIISSKVVSTCTYLVDLDRHPFTYSPIAPGFIRLTIQSQTVCRDILSTQCD